MANVANCSYRRARRGDSPAFSSPKQAMPDKLHHTFLNNQHTILHQHLFDTHLNQLSHNEDGGSMSSETSTHLIATCCKHPPPPKKKYYHFESQLINSTILAMPGRAHVPTKMWTSWPVWYVAQQIWSAHSWYTVCTGNVGWEILLQATGTINPLNSTATKQNECPTVHQITPPAVTMLHSTGTGTKHINLKDFYFLSL